MPQIAHDLVGTSTGMCNLDRTDLTVAYAADITDVCRGRGSRRQLLLFARTEYGLMAILAEHYAWRPSTEIGWCYYMSELDEGWIARKSDLALCLQVFSDGLHTFAQERGMTPVALFDLIKEHAKAVPDT